MIWIARPRRAFRFASAITTLSTVSVTSHSWCAEPAGVGGQGKMAFAFVTLITSLLSVVAASRDADVLTAS